MLSQYEIPADKLEEAQKEHWYVKGRTVNATQITDDKVAEKCIKAGSQVFKEKEKSELPTTSLAATEPAPALKEVEPEEPAGDTEVKAGVAAKKSNQSKS